MNIKELKPRKALNKAFLKVKPNRIDIEGPLGIIGGAFLFPENSAFVITDYNNLK